MTFRVERLVRDLATKAGEFASSLRRQAPAANMIGKFAVDHVTRRIRGTHTREVSPKPDNPPNA